jgi:hypothetical protein
MNDSVTIEAILHCAICGGLSKRVRLITTADNVVERRRWLEQELRPNARCTEHAEWPDAPILPP